MMHASVTAPVPWLDGRERGMCQHRRREKGRQRSIAKVKKKERKKETEIKEERASKNQNWRTPRSRPPNKQCSSANPKSER